MKSNITNILQKPLALVAALAALMLCSCADLANSSARVARHQATQNERRLDVQRAEAALNDAKAEYEAEVRRGIHTGPARERYNLAHARHQAALESLANVDALLGRARRAHDRDMDFARDVVTGIWNAGRHSDLAIHGTGAQAAAQSAAHSAAGAAAASAASNAASAAHSSVCAPMR